MKRTWPIIAVKDVEASSAWYLSLLGQAWRPTGHSSEFDQILDDDGTVLVCLHRWGAHGEGPPLESPQGAAPGNGVLLSILVEDFEACLQRARGLGEPCDIEEARHEGDWRMFTIRDPDGYYVSIYAMQDIKALEAREQAGN
jgi:catechol 2,3-dioxygenase-like lactoylglutathione lyase family enzyme